MKALNRIELRADDVHIWRARLDVNPAVLRGLSRTLAPEEVERARQFRFVHHRSLFVAARGILRHILSNYVRTAPQALLLRSDANGKPFMPQDECGVRFNVSHSGTWALYAVARHEVGIDIEQIDPRLATPAVAVRVFTSGELAEWHALPVSTRSRFFFDCWTRKEACLKGRAEGLLLPLNELEVWSAEDKSRSLLNGGKTWSLRSFKPAAGYSAAVAVEGECSNVKYLNFRWNSRTFAINNVAHRFPLTAIPS